MLNVVTVLRLAHLRREIRPMPGLRQRTLKSHHKRGALFPGGLFLVLGRHLAERHLIEHAIPQTSRGVPGEVWFEGIENDLPFGRLGIVAIETAGFNKRRPVLGRNFRGQHTCRK